MANLSVKDGNGDPQTIKSSLDGGAHVTHSNIDTLPASFTTDTSAIKVAAQALAALISGSRFPVDLSATALGYLSTLAGTVTSSRVAVDLSTTLATYLGNLPNIATYLGTLAGAITSSRLAVNVDSTTTGKLDALAPGAAVYDGVKNVTTAGNRVQLPSQTLVKGVYLRAKDTNTGLIYYGGSSVSSSSQRLAAGEPSGLIPVNQLSLIWLDAAVSGEGVTYHAV